MIYYGRERAVRQGRSSSGAVFEAVGEKEPVLIFGVGGGARPRGVLRAISDAGRHTGRPGEAGARLPIPTEGGAFPFPPAGTAKRDTMDDGEEAVLFHVDVRQNRVGDVKRFGRCAQKEPANCSSQDIPYFNP